MVRRATGQIKLTAVSLGNTGLVGRLRRRVRRQKTGLDMAEADAPSANTNLANDCMIGHELPPPKPTAKACADCQPSPAAGARSAIAGQTVR